MSTTPAGTGATAHAPTRHDTLELLLQEPDRGAGA
jgi:hypothetical protein